MISITLYLSSEVRFFIRKLTRRKNVEKNIFLNKSISDISYENPSLSIVSNTNIKRKRVNNTAIQIRFLTI